MQKIKVASKIFLLLLLVYSLLRLLFYYRHFNGTGITSTALLNIFYRGAWTDFAAILAINIPFLLLYFFYPKRTTSFFKLLLFVLCFSNFLFIALNLIDTVYFSFIQRRSTIDLLFVVKGSISKWLLFLKLYWPLVILFVAICLLLYYLFKKILQTGFTEKSVSSTKREKWKLAILYIGFLVLLVIVARGFEKKPLMPSTALMHAEAVYQPLINNSAFTFLYSVFKEQTILQEKNYYSTAEVDKLFPIKHQYDSPGGMVKKNVVVFIMESFSETYLDNNDPRRAKTPFFDSLLSKSVVCTNAYACSFESNKGIVAILAGIPPLTEEPYFYSPYSNAPYRGIGTILKDEGYSTNFFMGAEYDHFGFAKLCKLTGIDNYYSADTYNHPEHHDKTWGIYDNYFFPYALDVINNLKQPFFSTIFNISTHHPFNIPASLKKQFSIPGQTPAQNAATFYDYVLNDFFKKAAATSWFKNTLFVFTADHANWVIAKREEPSYKKFRIPIFFYTPDQSVQPGNINHIVEQTDIVPSILNMLGYSAPFMAFGKSIFDSSYHSSFSKINGAYQLLDSTTITGYDDQQEKTVYCYDYKADPLLKNNLVSRISSDSLLQQKQYYLKARIQQYHNSLIQKRLFVK